MAVPLCCILCSGDAILALWPVERMQLSEAISLVVRCGLIIQARCGVRKTEVGCQLRVKIGASLVTQRAVLFLIDILIFIFYIICNIKCPFYVINKN